MLYLPYVEVLVCSDPVIKQYIYSDEPIHPGEELIDSLGPTSFAYALTCDINNFDRILLANALADLVIQQERETLELRHI